MAITALTAIGGITVNITYRDFTGRTVTSSYLVPAATTLANAVAHALALTQALEPVSDAQIVAVNVGGRYTAVDSDVAVQGNKAEDKGAIGLRTAAGKVVRFTIPGIKNAKLLGQTRDIDLTDTDVAAVTTLLVTGDGTVAPVDSNASDFTQVVYGKLRQRSELDQD